VSNIFKNLLYFTRFVKRDIVHEHECLSIKARNDHGLKEFKELVCIVGTKCDIVCNDSFTIKCNHQKRNLDPFELYKFVGIFVLDEPFQINVSNVKLV
jgi:hypothetical protein